MEMRRGNPSAGVLANHPLRLCENLHIDIADMVAGKNTPTVDSIVQKVFLCLLPPNMPAISPGGSHHPKPTSNSPAN